MFYKFKLGLFLFLVFIKVTLLRDAGFSIVALTPLSVLLFFAIFFSIFRIVDFALDMHSPSKRKEVLIASPNEEQSNKYNKPRRNALSSFLTTLFAFQVVICLMVYVYEKEKGSLFSGNELAANMVLAGMVWIVIDVINSLTVKLIMDRKTKLLNKTG